MPPAEPVYVLVRNSVPLLYRGTAKEMLKAAPRGAYTTARTVARTSVLEFEAHMARLASSVRLMAEESAREAGAYAAAAATVASPRGQSAAKTAALAAAAGAGTATPAPGEAAEAVAAFGPAPEAITSAESLRPIALAQLRAGLGLYYGLSAKADADAHAVAEAEGDDTDPAAVATGTGSGAGEGVHHEARVTMLLTWGTPKQRGAVAGKAWWGEAADADGAGAADVGGELWAAGADPGFDVYTHIAPLPPPSRPPITVLARDNPRANAKAKDSAWAVAMATGHAVPAWAEEVLLVDAASGGVFEGTQTNFFALGRDGVLHTAEEGVLQGTIRGLVLEAAAALGVPVSLAPPQLREAGAWAGAFVCSTSRLVMPIDHLVVPAALMQAPRTTAASAGAGAGAAGAGGAAATAAAAASAAAPAASAAAAAAIAGVPEGHLAFDLRGNETVARIAEAVAASVRGHSTRVL